MSFYKKYNLIIYLLSIFIILILLISAGIYTSVIIEKHAKIEIEQKYNDNIKEFSSILKVLEKNSNNKLIASERIATDYLKTIAKVNIRTDDSINIEGVIEQTGQTSVFRIPLLYFGDSLILRNKRNIDKITYISSAFISIWQKIDDGYIRIVSNEIGEGNNQNDKIFIHNSAPLVQTIDKGEKYYIQQSIKYDSKISVFRPLYIDGFVRGAIQTTVYQGIRSSLSKIYENTSLNKNSQAFFITEDGNYIFNSGEDESFKLSDAFRFVKSKKSGKINYSTIVGNKLLEKTVYFEKINSLDGYAGIVVAKKTFETEISKAKRKILNLFLLISFLIIIFVSFILYLFYKLEIKIFNQLNSVVSGDYEKDKVIKILGFELNINKKINKVYEDIKETEKIAELLAEYNENNIVELPEIKNNLSKYFIKLHKNIKDIISIHKEQISENDLRESLSSKMQEISGILQHDDDFESLSLSLIRKILRFLELEMGGIFVVNRVDPGNVFLKMTANFAFGKERLKNKIIKPNSGLIGRCYLEKQSIYITEIPKDYAKVESGFGETEPKSLVIVPLIFNNIVQGVIELASISEIEPYKIEFVENIGENIASTFASIDSRLHAERLLEQTQKQAKQINTQRTELQEKIDTHRRQNRKLDKKLIEVTEIIKSIRLSAYVIEFDLTGKVLDVNEKFLNLLGVDEKEIIGKNHSELVKDDNYELTYKTIWKDLKNGDSEERTEKIFVKDKGQFTFLNIYAPIRSSLGRIYRVLAIGSLLYEEYQK